MNIKLFKIIFVILITITAITEGLYLFALPYLLNKELSSGKINSTVQQKTGLNLAFKNTNVKTYPDFSIRFSAKDISITDKNKKKIFTAENINTKIWLPSFALKKLTLKSFNADNTKIVIVRQKDKKLYLGDYQLKISPNFSDINSDLNGIKVNNADIILDDRLINKKLNAKIHSLDFYYQKSQKIGLVINSDIFINDQKKTEIYTKFSSKLPVEKGLKGKSGLLEGHIKNLDLSDFSNYIGYFLKQDIVSSTGVVNAEFKKINDLEINASLKNFYIKMKNPLDNIMSKEEIKLFSSVGFETKKLLINKMDVKSDDWHIKINGFVKNYTASNLKNVKPDLNIEIADSNINSLYWLVPSIKDDPQNVMQKFKKYGAWGKANGKIQIKGSASLPEIYGDLTANDVYIVKDNPLVPHCKIFAKFLKDNVKINTRVFAGYGEYVDIDGIAQIKIYGKGDFKVKSSKNVDLSTAEYMLVPIHEVVGFDLGPVPYMKIKGKGDIEIRTKGTVKDGEVYGQFNFRNTTAALDGLNTVLHNANGALVFNGKDMHFYTTSAQIKNRNLKVDGNANLEGNIDFDITSPSMDFEELLKILNTSTILKSRKILAEPVEKITGNTKVDIKIKGIVKDFSQIADNPTLSITGKLIFSQAAGKLKITPQTLDKMNGFIDFDDGGWKADFKGNIGSSPLSVKGYANTDKIDIKIYANKLKTDEVIASAAKDERFKNLEKFPKTNSFLSFSGEYKSLSGIKEGKINLNDITANGRFFPIQNKNQNSQLNITNGEFSLSHGKFILKNFNAKVFDSLIKADITAEKLFSQKPIFSGRIKTDNFNISAFNTLKKADFMPAEIKKLLLAYENYEGIANVNIRCRNNNFDGYIDLKDINFNHSYFKTPIALSSGKILLKDSKLSMKSMIAQVDNTPVFLNFSVWDLDKTMHFNGYITTKITEYFVNKYINSYLDYPIKPKGDITLITNISGDLNSFRIVPKIKLAKEADIYYKGANLGDEANEREINADITVKQNTYYIKKADYIRYMVSQNNKEYPLLILHLNGILNQNFKDKKQVYIKNLNVETVNNANAKIFNVIFKKSVLKNGMFNCRLNIKGKPENPFIKGYLSMENIDMPLFDTTLKNISIKFKDKSIKIDTDGIVYNSDFSINTEIQNKLKPPYIIDNINIKSQKLNLDTFIDSLTSIPTPDTVTKMTGSAKTSLPLNISDIQIRKGKMEVKDIIIRGLPAKNYTSEFNLDKNLVLDIDKLWFDVTTGKMTGTANYNFKNGKIKANISALNVDSNEVASKLFEFKNQIFGQANGNIVFSTTGNTEEERLKNMFGYVYFEIANGKMPKLGSVEYLLKAGNFIKSGLTGASISNFIDLITPIKTGSFDSIKGNFSMKNGVAQNIEVYSKGENLNIYINGEFDILQQYANLRVYGRLTKNATNILGKVGNLSFNSLLNAIPGFKLNKNDEASLLKDLNKIPGVELSDQQYRIFTVKVDGNINEEKKFVKNFRWIE